MSSLCIMYISRCSILCDFSDLRDIYTPHCEREGRGGEGRGGEGRGGEGRGGEGRGGEGRGMKGGREEGGRE